MRNVSKLPSLKELKDKLSYHETTGILIWKFRARKYFGTQRAFSTWNSRYAGKAAGSLSWSSDSPDRKYLKVTINGRGYRAHRIVWKIKTGKDSTLDIDHIDGDPLNNRWSNLREVTPSQNLVNSKMNKNNSSGARGVQLRRGKWVARAKIDYKNIYLGAFDSKEEAIETRVSFMRKMFGEYTKE